MLGLNSNHVSKSGPRILAFLSHKTRWVWTFAFGQVHLHTLLKCICDIYNKRIVLHLHSTQIIVINLVYIHNWYMMWWSHHCYIKMTWCSSFISTQIRGPFYQYGLTLILAWISNQMPSKVWDEIAYPLPNSNACTVELWEGISHFIPHFTIDVITCPCLDLSWSILVKRGPSLHDM